MILIKSPIDLTESVIQSIKNNLSDQKHANDIASDGSFLEVDGNGTVKLFESNVADIATAKSPTTSTRAELASQETHGPTEASQEPISDSTCDPSPTHTSYQRPDITLYDRLQIATCFWHPERAWGTVTELAQQYATSRQTIYQIAYQAQRGLVARQPGPKCQPAQIEITPTTSLTIQTKVASAETQKDGVRERIILTSVFPGAVTMRPLEQILNEIPAINSCSDTTIWRVIKQAGQDADRILSEVNYQNVKLPLVFVAIDETYFNGYPIFFIVEPISLAICAYYIPSDKDRSADNWSCLLELLKNEQNLNIIGGLGDAAKAYPKAFKDLLDNDESFGEDHFHLLYAVNRLLTHLERSAYSALNQVETLITKWCKGKASEEEIEKCEQEAMKKVDLYDEFNPIASWIGNALEMIDLSSGEIRDREINEWALDLAISQMKKLEHKKIKKMCTRIKTHKKKLLKYIDWLNSHLSEPIEQLHQELNDSEIESYMINLVARYWRVNHAVESLKYRSLRKKLNRLCKEVEFWIKGDPWLANWTKNVLQLFSSIQRTSSAVENINSILKPMIRNKKHFGSSQSMENFVALFALWHNLRRFEEGKRKGKSPFDILGIEMESSDWRTLLGYPPTN